ncbi:Transcriptional regulator, TetR family [Streptococcus porcinus]|uniref:TetR/AcrR family transcriptional regulator n=1 Tax=Streptococcus porcinus TaxID=1340 RepID=A0A4U9YSV9_STRPO|nr:MULTISPECIES: TetR/AcrR family transcriptional regulator [Streptococcus]MBA2794914.1 TetR/AcrR family transcriptional regulator [Streptococcus porcinus]MEC4578115.1 TetR/AcrR family transcriptional regulator [Streptococcus dysgalactiae]VTS29574.1 Transcriptional regulator, TetR family [Streptococcus porcinus]
MSSLHSTDLKLLEALSELLKFKSYKQIKVSELVEKASISRRAFYNHYNSKEDFLEEAILIIFDDITKILNNDLLYECEVVEKVLKYMYNHKGIIHSFVYFFPKIEILINDYIKEMIVSSNIPNLKKQLEIAYGVPYKFALEIYVFTIEIIILQWVRNDFKESPEKIANYITTVVRI